MKLKALYEQKTNRRWSDSDGKPDLGYVEWLEQRAYSSAQVENHPFRKTPYVWDEMYKSTILRCIESIYADHIIRSYCIADILLHTTKRESISLVKWVPRIVPLDEEQFYQTYGRKLRS
jgi:hypothetical protein